VSLGLGQYVQIAAGALLAGSGLWLLVRRRFAGRQEPLHITGSGDSRKLSEPTTIACALILLLMGYHAIVWAFPEYLTAVQLNRKIWYVWILIGILGIAASILMDRFDPENSDSSGDTPA
jgi:hypothetical protein